MDDRGKVDPRTRFRVWVDAELVDEAWVEVVSASELAEIQARQMTITDEAERRDSVWLVEVYDPETDRYWRFGTDADGMVDPQPVPR